MKPDRGESQASFTQLVEELATVAAPGCRIASLISLVEVSARADISARTAKHSWSNWLGCHQDIVPHLKQSGAAQVRDRPV
jgi:hypothetical protein